MNRKLGACAAVLAIALVVTLSVFAGGQKDAGGAPKMIVLRWYTDSDEATNTQRMYPQIAADYTKAHPNIKVEFTPLVANYNSDEYMKKADLMIAAGEQIDLLGHSTLEHVQMRVKSGVLLDLVPFATKEGIDLDKEYDGIIPMDGKIYTIPEYTTMWLIYLNQDLLNGAGLSVPPKNWTWDDYRSYSKKIAKGEGSARVYGSYLHTWDWFYAIGMQGAIWDKPYYKADRIHHNFDNPVFRDGMKFRYDMENLDKSQVPFADVKGQNMAYRSVFFGGKAAMLPMGAWMVADINLKEKYPHTFKTTFAYWPMWYKTDTPNTTTLDGAGSGWGINAKTKYPQEAYDLLRFVTSEGWEYSHKQWSAWKKADPEETLKGIGGSDTSTYDIQALKAILYDPNRNPNKYTFVGPGERELIDAYIQENEKYLVGGQSLDQTMTTIKRRAEEIIDTALKNQ